MAPKVELVDPVHFASAASEVLRAAWSPPCLHYSPAYLQWQLTFPATTPARLVMAFDGPQPAACAGLTPRQFLLDGTIVDGYVLSFVAVDPVARRQHLSTRLYEALLDVVPETVPVIAFTQPESTGERVLLKAIAGRFIHQALRPSRAYGYAPRRVDALPVDDYSVLADATEGDFVTASRYFDSPRVLWNAPSPDTLRHYAADPRRRSRLVVMSRGGQPVGTAMSVVVEMATGGAPQHVPMLENFSLFEPSPGILRSALAAVSDLFPNTSVIAPNLSHLDESVVKAAFCRTLPSLFNVHFFCRTRSAQADATNIEVI